MLDKERSGTDSPSTNQATVAAPTVTPLSSAAVPPQDVLALRLALRKTPTSSPALVQTARAETSTVSVSNEPSVGRGIIVGEIQPSAAQTQDIARRVIESRIAAQPDDGVVSASQAAPRRVSQIPNAVAERKLHLLVTTGSTEGTQASSGKTSEATRAKEEVQAVTAPPLAQAADVQPSLTVSDAVATPQPKASMFQSGKSNVLVLSRRADPAAAA
jgi:hypothetical protein